MKKETAGTILALLTALVSGFAIPINKMFVVDLDPLVFTAVRALIVGLVFLTLSGFRIKLKGGEFRKAKWKYLLAIGIIGGGLAFWLYFTGLSLTTAGRAAFLHKSLPVWATLFAVLFLKERVSRRQFYALVSMLVGVLILYLAKIGPSALWANPGLGDFLIIAATMLWALENVIARKAMLRGETHYIVSFARMFFGALILFGILLLLGRMEALLALKAQQLLNITISTAMLFAYVFCWYQSIRLINLSKAASILLLSPVITLLLGIAFLGEPLPSLQLLGSALILAGALVMVRVKSGFLIRKPKEYHKLSTGV
jgi:drug/metabolite transporter (DMT)-like permease